MVDLFRYRKWDLVSKRGLYYLISGLMLVIGIVAMFYNKATIGKAMNWGIDFLGGSVVTYRIDGKVPVGQEGALIGEIREKQLKDVYKLNGEVQIAPGSDKNPGDQIIVRTLLPTEEIGDMKAALDAQVQTSIKPAIEAGLAKYGLKLDTKINGARPESQDFVSGSVSRELINQGALALILGTMLIMGWIWLRYNIGGLGNRYAFAGVIALGHDLLALIGIFAILHNVLQVNSPFIAALLTVLGYSIHDTIVIFDRIRENIKLRKGRTFAETVNISLLETMARSVNTILTVLITLLALFFFGGPTLRDFVAAMLIGLCIGGYSSIFIASQLLVSWSPAKEKVILPFDATVAAPSVPEPVTAGSAVAPSAPSAQASSQEAIQRARQAGKTAKRRR